ncbi:hypothetical protein TrCOL_g4199 [Triparma columacea]|uniref:Uncharacterized protein n=1 Tax=Triparma columacea TaxID=722753 RepID=A0A9W7GFD7_9STRA|nr:hypothetical protein TrCOL_g4199 [Triparma columacea]
MVVCQRTSATLQGRKASGTMASGRSLAGTSSLFVGLYGSEGAVEGEEDKVFVGWRGKRGEMERTLSDVIERAEGIGGGEKDKVMGVWFMMGRYEQARECYERFTGFCSNNGEWRESLSGA